MTFSIVNLPAHVAAKISIDADSGCWVWTACTLHGYGTLLWTGRRLVRAHRLVFHLLADPTLPLWPGSHGDQLDHLCRNPPCVNPEHLEQVNRRENIIRGKRGVLGAHTSPFVGVCWDRVNGKWKVQIRIPGGGDRGLGRFQDEIAAAIAYDDAAEIYLGERTNERLGLL
jgi:hypothetical protein